MTPPRDGGGVLVAAGPAYARGIGAALRWAARVIIIIGAVFGALYPGAIAITAAITVEGLASLGLIALVLPVRYEVHAEGLWIVFRFDRRWRVSFDDVDRVAPPRRPGGNRVVVLRQGKGFFSRRPVSFSPAEGERFAAVANGALAEWRAAKAA
jgi:hypothetical protein